jgi:serine/threonine-protein kinase HipA
MVFNVLAKNCDDHTKNFAFILKKGERWALAPAYDLCYAYDATNVWVNQQTLSVNGKRSGFVKEDLVAVAQQMNIKKPLQIIEHVQTVIGDWLKFADQSGVSKAKAQAIQKNLPKI